MAQIGVRGERSGDAEARAPPCPVGTPCALRAPRARARAHPVPARAPRSAGSARLVPLGNEGLDHGDRDERALELVGRGAGLLPQEDSSGEVDQGVLEVALVEVNLAAVLAGESGNVRPVVRFGIRHAVRQLVGGIVELALRLQHLGATDAARRELFAGSGEPCLAGGLVGDVPGLVEAAEQAQQRGLLVQRGQAAQRSEFIEALSGGAEVDLLAQGDCVVTEDDAQSVVL